MIVEDRRALKEWKAFDRAVLEWLQAQGLEGEHRTWICFPTSKEGKEELLRQIGGTRWSSISLEEWRRKTMRAQLRLTERSDELTALKALDRSSYIRKQLALRSAPCLLFFLAAFAARATWPELSVVHLVVWPLLGFVFAHIILGFSGLLLTVSGLYWAFDSGGSWWWLALLPLGIGLGGVPEMFAWFREKPDSSLGVEDVRNAFEE